ncbi:UPF0182 family protein [Thermodesulfobacteriota bacterium]
MNKKRLLLGLGLIAVLIIWSVISMYPDWLWFDNLGFSPVFIKMLFSRFGFGIIVWFVLILLIYINLYAAKRLNPGYAGGAYLKERESYAAQFGLSERTLNNLIIAFVLILSFFIASKASNHWDLILRYLYQEPFGGSDPIFNKDIGFYIFSLPFYILIRNGLMLLVVVSLLITAGWYLKNGALQIEGDLSPMDGASPSMPSIKITPNAKKHIIFICSILLFLMAWGYYLKIFGLLYSIHGASFGASYADVYIKVWAYRILIFLSLAFGVVLIYNAFNLKFKSILISGGIWIASIVLFTYVLPPLAQKFIVKPNELAKESQFIKHNIKFTRNAYNLNKIKEVDFNVSDKLTLEDLEKNDATIQNIRVWDERPLLQTYKQLETLRPYYDFHNVDVDRYQIDGKYRQVMIAARELVSDQIPSNTWVNKHLKFTHGYGLVSSPVNEVTKEGLPELFIKGLPPISIPDMKVDRPEVYFGERTDDYVLIKTEEEELDYGKGDKNVYTIYKGEGGVLIGSIIRKLLFAIEFMDPQIFFTTSLKPDSRIMYNRRIKNRVNIIAPFLNYDSDPYMVVSQGKLFWILDAYTTSEMYPYSSRSLMPETKKYVNYIRNSVKVIVDAYNGKVSFYTVDEEDPILKTYKAIFPHLFKPFSSMPDDIKKHVRYPKDLFKIQVNSYTKYHMDDVQVFYNQEDLWQIPDEIYGDRRLEMEPYYIMIKLPEEEKVEFFLMQPVTPSKKDNMIGWLAARCDQTDYGNLLVYKLPKKKLVYGPMQIEARVDQQTEISRELSLWGQRGSRVIRGNLLAIPVGDTFIYVEPVYLEAKQEEAKPAPAQSQPRGFFAKPQGNKTGGGLRQAAPKTAASLPELKRVIVAFGNRLVMHEKLDGALRSILSEDIIPEQPATVKSIKPVISSDENLSGMAEKALDHYRKAKEHLRNENWAGYGEELEQLENILHMISEKKEK